MFLEVLEKSKGIAVLNTYDPVKSVNAFCVEKNGTKQLNNV